jgi:hypothetical protein
MELDKPNFTCKTSSSSSPYVDSIVFTLIAARDGACQLLPLEHSTNQANLSNKSVCGLVNHLKNFSASGWVSTKENFDWNI